MQFEAPWRTFSPNGPAGLDPACYCLFAIAEDNVKLLMRSGASDAELAALARRNNREGVGRPRAQHGALCRSPGPCIPSVVDLRTLASRLLSLPLKCAGAPAPRIFAPLTL